jgi:aspartokinase
MPTVTELTNQYLSEHPSIKDCLKNSIINYSRLSRKIAKELGIEKSSTMEAILIACRRYSEKVKKEAVQENRIKNILKKSELDIKNRIIVAIVDKRFFVDHLIKIETTIRKQADLFYAIEGTSTYTIITLEKYQDEIKSVFKANLRKLAKDLALITLKSPEDMEGTSGVVDYLYSIFGENGVNIVETMSCWTDTIFVISENDVQKVIKFLKF